MRFNCGFVILIHLAFTLGRNIYDEPKYLCPQRHKLIFPCICLKGSDEGVFIKCDNVNLATLSVALQNLAILDIPVESLVISGGHFERLYGSVFSKIKARLLYIENTPIKIIENNVFFGINKTVEEIHINRSNLTFIGPQTFGNLGKLMTLVIDGHLLEKLDKNLFSDQDIANKLEVIRIINGPLKNIPIETFQPLRKLKMLDLHGNQLETLMRNQFKNLRTVEILDISSNNLKSLEAHHLADMTKLVWCNASHNNLSELSRGTFARNAVLKVLNLSYNEIKRLDGNSFRGMRFLRRLFINDNKIDDIGRGTFGSVNRIGTIDLARNKLKKVGFQMFSQLNYVEILNLAENNISTIEKQSFKDIYQAMINISHNVIETIEPYAFENCVNITVLDLSFNRLSNFSKNAVDATTFATEFQLSYNLFTNLAAIPIQNMTGIRVLNITHNKITEIPKNTFPKLYELHTIDVSFNNISFIANSVFQTLFSLRSINLSNNNLQEIKAPVFGTLPTLLDLDLSFNNLESISRSAFVKLISLRTLLLNGNRLENLFQIPISLNKLYLNRNNIKSIPPNTWPVMNSLLFLDLSNNKIGDSLETDSFSGLLVLQKLLLNNNEITRPPRECLAAMSTLQYLFLEYNNITDLKKNAFGKLPVLFELNLFKNEIKEIGKHAFEGLLQLLVLNLSSNAISTIPNDAFIGLPSLRKLDLSFNYLTKLDNKTNGVLDDLFSLEDLNLSHNKISFVTKKTFPSHKYIPYNLKYLDLSYNQMPVLTYDITFGTKKLLSFNLSHNHINELRRGVLANFTTLQILDLSYNELYNLQTEEHIFDLPRNLTHIYLQNNQIYRIPYEKFTKDPKFIYINLKNNNLTQFPSNLVILLENDTNVLFSGNPIDCNCGARPLKHFLIQNRTWNADMQHIYCHTPIHLYNQKLINVPDEKLNCVPNEKEIFEGPDYDELTDVKFRDIKINKNGDLNVKWFVISPKDIADFTVYIREDQNKILYEADFGYNERIANISLNKLTMQNRNTNAEVCIVTKNSNTQVGRFYSEQCQRISEVAGMTKYKYKSISSTSSVKISNNVFVYVISLLIHISYKFHLKTRCEINI